MKRKTRLTGAWNYRVLLINKKATRGQLIKKPLKTVPGPGPGEETDSYDAGYPKCKALQVCPGPVEAYDTAAPAPRHCREAASYCSRLSVEDAEFRQSLFQRARL